MYINKNEMVFVSHDFFLRMDKRIYKVLPLMNSSRVQTCLWDRKVKKSIVIARKIEKIFIFRLFFKNKIRKTLSTVVFEYYIKFDK